jgi:hypothetical protein
VRSSFALGPLISGHARRDFSPVARASSLVTVSGGVYPTRRLQGRLDAEARGRACVTSLARIGYAGDLRFFFVFANDLEAIAVGHDIFDFRNRVTRHDCEE